MRIGLSTSVVQRGKTGIASYVIELVRALVSSGEPHEIVAFVLEEDAPLFDAVRHQIEFVPVSERYRSPLRDILWHQTLLPSLVRKHQIEVLHVPSYRRMLWPQPCPLVATVHDLAACRVRRKYDWKRMAYGRFIAPRLAARQQEIIAVSHNTSADLQSLWRIPRERISVVHHGLNHERFNTRAGTEDNFARKTMGLSQPFFLYVARLEHPAKGHVRLVKAFERFKRESGSDWRLVFAGSDWHGAGIIHDTIQRSPVSAHIHCLGFVPESLLPALYRLAGAFVCPSLHEGFGFPVLEAMACGCPVLCSRRGALSELAGLAAAAWDPEDEADMKNQLRDLACNTVLRESLRRAGLNRARQFQWRRTAAETLRVYRKALLAQPRPPFGAWTLDLGRPSRQEVVGD